MTPFLYARPRTLEELFMLMRQHGPRARLLAGGTDAVVRLRKGGDQPDAVIDLKHVSGLQAEVSSTPGGLRIGARTTISDFAAAPLVREHFPALIDAALTVGSVQIRNRATLTGNICNASPAADTAVALLGHSARVNLRSSGESRQMPLDAFFVGPGSTALTRGEIVESIDVPLPAADSGAAFARLTRRRGVDLAIVSVCCHVRASGEIRFALGAVGPRPLVVTEDTGHLLAIAADRVRRLVVLNELFHSASPRSDLRGDRLYRTSMLPIFAGRALDAAIERMHQGPTRR